MATAASTISESPETVLPERIGEEEEAVVEVEVQELKTTKKKKKR